jgi:hypothetical protein
MENLLEKVKLKDLKKFDPNDSLANSVCFIGTPFRNPNLKDKIFLSTFIFSNENIFYEFDLNDVVKFEEIDNIIDKDGNNYSIYKIWIKKGSKGIKHETFTIN